MIAMLQDFFFPKRLSRLPYFIRFILFKLVDVSFYATDFKDIPWYYTLFYLLLLYYTIRYVVVPRARDCGWPWWIALFVMVPFIGIVAGLALLFKPTNVLHVNTYEEIPVRKNA
jgi:uncharacterized membrane protein YhaH (DUF805 family)